MPYNANIPQPTDQISDSQSDLLNNFGSINTWVLVNHGGFDSPPNTGKHLFVEMPQQAAVSTTTNGEVGLQCLASEFGAGLPTLVYIPENNLGTNYIEMTSGDLTTPGWTILPSGLIMQWGFVNVTGPGSYTAPLNTATFPPFATTLLFTGFQFVSTTAIPDVNLAAYLNINTSSLTTLGINVVARTAGPTSISSVAFFVIGV